MSDPYRDALARDPLAPDATVHLLQVQDDPGEVRRLLEASRSLHFELRHAASLEECHRLLQTELVEVVLLDLPLPESDGLATLSRLRQDFPLVPIVVVTGDASEELAVDAMRRGAEASLSKDELSTSLLVRTIRQVLDRHRVIVALGRSRERERHLSTHDQLTGLPNRSVFFDRLDYAICSAQRHNRSLGVLLLNLDGVAKINDTLGHGAGDELLRCIARRLEAFVRRSDTVARLDGDEFALLLSEVRREADAERVARQVLELLAEPVALRGEEYVTTGSIGIVTFPGDGDDPSALIRNADTAMYHAKRRAGDSYRFYSAEMSAAARSRLQLETHLRSAVKQNNLVLHYQPQVDVVNERTIGFEALLRCLDWEGRLLAPGEFLDLAEETRLIVPIGEWVLREACRQASEWRESGECDAPRMAVNVSLYQLQEPEFVGTVLDTLREVGLPPEALELEVTETCLATDFDETVATLRALKEVGVRIAVDDFGTGYSALSYLKLMPVDVLKLDRAFVAGIVEDCVDATLVTAMVTMARGLELQTVAEGVETHAQLEALRGLGCHEMQGFLFARPAPPDELGGWLGGAIPPEVLARLREGDGA